MKTETLEAQASAALAAVGQSRGHDKMPSTSIHAVDDENGASYTASTSVSGKVNQTYGNDGRPAGLDSEYREIIRKAVAAATGLSVAGAFVPGTDMAGMGAVWAVMISSIASKSERQLSRAAIAKLVTASIGAVSSYYFAGKALTLMAIPAVIAFPYLWLPAVVAFNVMLNGVFTLRLGLACVQLFSRSDSRSMDPEYLAADVTPHLMGAPTAEEMKIVRTLLRS